MVWREARGVKMPVDAYNIEVSHMLKPLSCLHFSRGIRGSSYGSCRPELSGVSAEIQCELKELYHSALSPFFAISIINILHDISHLRRIHRNLLSNHVDQYVLRLRP